MGPEPEAAGEATDRYAFVGVGEPPQGLAKTIHGRNRFRCSTEATKNFSPRQFVSSLLI